MSVRSIVFVFWLLLGVAWSVAAEPTGVYVNKQSPYYRIEFLKDGKSFLGHPYRSHGTYVKEKDTYVCQDERQQETRYQLKGESLIDQDGDEWVPRDGFLKMPWMDLSPVTMIVLDRETRSPVTKFSYTYSISTPGAKYDPLLVRPIKVHSADGSFVLSAPPSCEIHTRIEDAAILGGFGTRKAYPLTTENKLRRIEVLVDLGSDIKGIVVDKRTGRPLRGAIVSPIIFTPPLWTPDSDRSIKTDAKGRFTMRGVDYDLGIHVGHPDYFEFNRDGFTKVGEKTGKNTYLARIELESGETLFGTVKDPSGAPLAGVSVSDQAGKRVRTDKDGSFVLRSPRKLSNSRTYLSNSRTYDLSFEKEGHLSRDLRPESADPDGFSVLLQPQPLLTGRVLDSAGQPVTKFEVTAGVGAEPTRWKCSTAQVTNAKGRFNLRVSTDVDYEKEGTVWIGVRAPGFALWETTVDIWENSKSVTAHLKPGVVVRGLVEQRRKKGDITVQLLPRRIHKVRFTRETSQRQQFGRMETTIDEGGSFRFHHVTSGQYILTMSGSAISPFSTGIAVSDTSLDVGKFSTQGRGSVHGVVYEPDGSGKVWAFADGEIYFTDNLGNSNQYAFGHLEPLPFKTDEKGQFHVESVPVGTVSLNIPYHISADIIGAYSRFATVVEEKATEVRFFDKSGDWKVACQIVVGDGSPAQFSSGTGMGAKRKVENVTTEQPMFSIELEPKAGMPLSFAAADWEGLDEQNQILLQDVHPGSYRLRVGDWMMSRGFRGVLHERDVDIKPGETKLKIPLGAGCITGAVRSSKDTREMIQILAVSKMRRIVRRARCDGDGNFCLRYLSEDHYVLYAHDHDAGWCVLPAVAVENNITDIGSHELRPGGTIAGPLPPKFAIDSTVTVVATDANGIPVENVDQHDPGGEQFTISGLWPGKWTVTLKKGGQVIAEQAVRLHGVETAACKLVRD